MTGAKRDRPRLHLVATKSDEPKAHEPKPSGTYYSLRLYVAGHTSKSVAAIRNLRTICEERLAGRYSIEVIDLLKSPQLAEGDQIVAVPALVRRLPPPLKTLIGNLADKERVLVGLDLREENGHGK